MKVDQFAAMRGYQSARSVSGSAVIDHFLQGDQAGEIRDKFLTKRIQFDTHPALHDELEKVCSMLDCSKREFLEMVVAEACQKAQQVFSESFQQAGGVEILGVQ